ncbi:acyl carrier protein, partial [Nonomuraea sp. KC401]
AAPVDPADRADPVAPEGSPIAVETATGEHGTETVDERLRLLWTQALGVTDFPADQDFFDAGGNSLAAVEFIARIRESFGVRLGLGLLLERRTLAGIALALREQGAR